MRYWLAILSTALAVLPLVCLGQDNPNAARPAEPTLDAPTLVCLGVRWPIAGDANANAAVNLEYRKLGDAEWRKALPLFRVETAAMATKPPAGTTLYAGSIFNLQEDTEYELRLTLTDPDGGDAERTLRGRTRAEPKPAPDARTLHVTPGAGGGAGTAQDPFKGLAAAQAAAQPGDIFLLHAGVYSGTWTISNNGQQDRPIVWRAAGDGEAIIDGGGAERAISANRARFVHFDGLAIRNANWGLVAHEASELVVRRCHFYNIIHGFTATRNQPVCRNFYIADNVIEGPSTWPRTKGIEETEGIEVAGEGHVVCFNRIRGVADAISIWSAPPCNAIDFYNNEISECTDDGIEMDYGEQNVRCFDNRLTNCFQGISTQPLHGGPCYIFRNAMYNIDMEVFKLHNDPSGVLAFHNTCVKAGMPVVVYSNRVRRTIFRNNLFIGTEANYAMELTSQMVDCDFDYDGFGGGPFKLFAKWNNVRYATLAEAQKSGQLEAHGVMVNAATLFASGIQAPRDVKQQFDIAVNDLRLRDGAEAIDKGLALPGLNDGYAGNAPDLGAYELGSPLPHYGPR